MLCASMCVYDRVISDLYLTVFHSISVFRKPNVFDMFNRGRFAGRKRETTRDFARVNHGETQLIIARSFSHGKNISRSKEISDDTGQSTQGGRRWDETREQKFRGS